MLAIEKAGFTAGKEILLGLDAASSECRKNGRYELASEGRSYQPRRGLPLGGGRRCGDGIACGRNGYRSRGSVRVQRSRSGSRLRVCAH